jgi:hypothetical protein
MPRPALAAATLSLVLLGLVVVLLAVPSRPAATAPAAAALRVRALELVDDRGRVRSRLAVEPDGEVVLRLLDPDGTVRVKLGADAGGSGLVLLDETTAPGLQLLARRVGTPDRPATTRIALSGADGRRRTLEP